MPSIPPHSARAWAEVDLAALIQNARTVARIAGAPLLPMVKAGGYGVGAPACAHALEAVDPWGFGVATLQEGVDLRTAGITRPIIVFAPVDTTQFAICRTQQLRPVLCDESTVRAWIAAGKAPFHVDIDTGMARGGIRWDAPRGWMDVLRDAPGFEGVFTHFHSADTDPASIQQQWNRFQAVVKALPVVPPIVHAANSAAALRGTAWAANLVRPGIFLYGGAVVGVTPKPVVRLRAPVVALRTVRAGDTVSYNATWTAQRDTVIATIAAGYADGVPRALGNQGVIELRGQRFPIVGRVTMDFLMVAVDEAIALGDIATIYGGLVSIDEQATRAGTIAYELLTSLGPRVERRYQPFGVDP